MAVNDEKRGWLGLKIGRRAGGKLMVPMKFVLVMHQILKGLIL